MEAYPYRTAPAETRRLKDHVFKLGVQLLIQFLPLSQSIYISAFGAFSVERKGLYGLVLMPDLLLQK